MIIQNFCAKPGTLMAEADHVNLEELLWTIVQARLLLPPGISIQAPPNLSPGQLGALIDAGINDWGGVSPLTPDYVNPEAPWPNLNVLGAATEAKGKYLVPRLTVYPQYLQSPQWIDSKVRRRVLEWADAEGLVRDDDWRAGVSTALPAPSKAHRGWSIQALPGYSMPACAKRQLMRRRRWRYLALAMPMWMPSVRQQISCAKAKLVMWSLMWSIATSTIPTCVSTVVASARSPKEVVKRRRVARLMTSMLKSCIAASQRLPIWAPQSSVCKVSFIPITPARLISTLWKPFATLRRRCTSTRFHLGN